jgi:hypothetical protein
MANKADVTDLLASINSMYHWHHGVECNVVLILHSHPIATIFGFSTFSQEYLGQE